VSVGAPPVRRRPRFPGLRPISSQKSVLLLRNSCVVLCRLFFLHGGYVSYGGNVKLGFPHCRDSGFDARGRLQSPGPSGSGSSEWCRAFRAPARSPSVRISPFNEFFIRQCREKQATGSLSFMRLSHGPLIDLANVIPPDCEDGFLKFFQTPDLGRVGPERCGRTCKSGRPFWNEGPPNAGGGVDVEARRE
jgi:hypothetical protein